MRPIVLLTRPEAASRRFAARLEGVEAVIAPMMRIAPVAHDAARLAAAARIVLTSVHAVPWAGPGAGRVAFCVGPATAKAARAAGFTVIEGPGDAARLAPMLAGETGLLHPHGRHVTAGLPVEGMVVYDQIALPLPESGRAVLAGARPVLWPLFSPRSARLAAAEARKARAPLLPLAISKAAADAFGDWPEGVAVAKTPDAGGMLALIRQRLVARAGGR